MYFVGRLRPSHSKFLAPSLDMAISPMQESAGTTTCKSPKRKASTVEESKVSQRSSSKWEMKRRLAEKRLMSLGGTDTVNEESVIVETPILLDTDIPKERPTNDANSGISVSSSAMEKAEELQENLSLRFPSFVKLMLKSHVSGGFWLGLPKKFCVDHLPMNDEMIVLVDENEEEYSTKYLVDKIGLSGGWRGFSIVHNLIPDDVLVFQLIKPCRFKVYIVRARSCTEIDVVTSLQNPNFDEEDEVVKVEEKDALITETANNERLDQVPAENNRSRDVGKLDYLCEVAAASDDSSSETAVTLSESVLSFEDVKCFKDFSVHVDGLMIDAEIPLHLRTKYYDLCRSQNMLLHENLVKGLNTKLASGIIAETVNIADAIRAANSSTSNEDLQSWDRTLNAFEDLGMVVGFLRARIDKLLTLSRDVQAKIEVKGSEMAEAREEMRSLVVKLSVVRTRIKDLDAEIESLEVEKEELKSQFREVASTPW